MCGIGAILRTDGKPIPEVWLNAIDARIAYRGPDGHGRFRDQTKIDTPDGSRTLEVALIHRRLSIIDHEGGAQPMVSKRGRDRGEGLVAVVFNGCIYNHRELRARLESAGHRFVTDHSDTEVLIHGHREWGDRLQDHLEGMYAYVIWDRKAASLTLGRDFFGEKPLYYRISSDEDGLRLIVVSSDADATGSIPPDATAAPDTDLRGWVARYLQLGYAWKGRTIARDGGAVDNVEPSGRSQGYGSAAPGWHPPKPPSSRAEPVEPNHIEHLIEQAVARRLEADVPLGCFLSGGVDSSLIAYFAKKHKPDLSTFCVKMPDPRYDESAYAQRVAEHLGTDHTTLQVSINPAQDLVKLIDILGQPFGDSSILPTYWVAKAAREHVKVALSGDGGDELFVGYERYLIANLLATHHRLLARIPRGLFRRAHAKSRLHKLGRLGAMAREFPSLGLLATESILTQQQIGELLGESLDEPPRCDAPTDGVDALAALRAIDLHAYLPDDLLRKVDAASMAVALEVRCPYLDRDLAAALLAAPIEQLMRRGRRKGLLRLIARKYLPPETVDRPKMGFAIPLGHWFRTDFGGMRTLLLDHLRSLEPLGPIQVDRRVVRRFIDEHLSGERDHSHRLFALLTLAMWAKSM